MAVQVVLVRPETSANVGATARVLRNTGLASLALVAPCDWRTVECWRSAWGAHDVLEDVVAAGRVFEDLASALAGASYVVAFSGKPGASAKDVRDVAAQVAALPQSRPVSLVFGPEATGLREAEIALCGRRAVIPTHPDQPSLNLSHAVLVAGYEILRARRPPVPAPRPASHGEKERMLGLLREGLRAVGALPAKNTDGFFRAWRALFQRADLTPKELGLLEHMSRKMAQRRG